MERNRVCKGKVGMEAEGKNNVDQGQIMLLEEQQMEAVSKELKRRA